MAVGGWKLSAAQACDCDCDCDFDLLLPTVLPPNGSEQADRAFQALLPPGTSEIRIAHFAELWEMPHAQLADGCAYWPGVRRLSSFFSPTTSKVLLNSHPPVYSRA